MTTTQINLDQSESEILQAVSQRTGKGHDELVREALSLLAARYVGQDRPALLRKARGIWRDRTDLPELQSLRDELDRF
jgi:hypothetical protein